MKRIICDNCGENLLTKFLGVPITISCGYGHTLDGEEYHFCNSRCAISFLLVESRKENINKRNDLEFGKEN